MISVAGLASTSAGVSRRAWVMWLTSSLLVGALAVHRGDPIFIMLQAGSLTSATVILFQARRFRGLLCKVHARITFPAKSRARQGTVGRNATVFGAVL